MVSYGYHTEILRLSYGIGLITDRFWPLNGSNMARSSIGGGIHVRRYTWIGCGMVVQMDYGDRC